ncbi:hypothetical protein SPLC1_S051230 [Arthrospira platensis C1]|uniref:Uncharacterized protein n=1 Tax=Limnospira maxima CS-328 TaxID=513049 RepID=B5W491_LIMMA|nr:hypothetical protein AmaxDRAFT_3598 [Limnospira maxima CS-328]EKD10915.1 hypothetical protein SPLC1_S051230 [Arthrospira platensis C1]UWU50435.1 hypothetical protein APLC1_5349 [Arthrospira platensis C1]
MQELIAGGQLFVFFDKYNVWEEKNVIMDTKGAKRSGMK